MNKQIAIVGLGKMGANVARRLIKAGWEVVGYNRTASVTKELEAEGVVGTYSWAELAEKLTPPRTAIVVVPAGAPTEEFIFGVDDESGVANVFQSGDTIIDMGNSYYEDTVDRGKRLSARGFRFFDIGISGGPGGALHGACLMIGGDRETVRDYQELFEAMAAPGAYQHFPGVGAGHFVKMVHNGIEYGMMQALAEGFAILKEAPFHLDLGDVATIYNNQSVIESRLVGWLRSGYAEYGEDLTNITSTVNATGEGEWTITVANKLKVPAPVIKDAFAFRQQSADNPTYIGRVLSMLRNQFGGHSIEGPSNGRT